MTGQSPAVRLLMVAFCLSALTIVTCGGPTCETTCERVFTTCGFDYEDGGAPQGHLESCVDSCRDALEIPSREEEAVQWMSCASRFPCEGLNDPNGFAIREACPPDDYYYGDLTFE